ncbi:MAG TPA: NAD(P)-binding domain-containing protein [Draconibacterium sp.]|nr:NAD(P)-binding domain-containing protein [Draconibacterium sp.]
MRINYKQQILEKINKNTEVIGIIGLGYVSLPLAVNFAEAGVKVIGFDKMEAKVNKINSGENYIKDIRDAVLREVVDRVKLEATTDFTKMKECDALIIYVPTPLDKFRKPDMSYIEASCTAIGQNMKPGTFISLESTTYPTTTENFMLPLIEESSKNNPINMQKFVPPAEGDERSEGGEQTSFKHSLDFWLAYSPERVDPGNKTFHTKNTPKVLGAMTSEGLEIGMALYKRAIDHIYPVSSPRVAEMV